MFSMTQFMSTLSGPDNDVHIAIATTKQPMDCLWNGQGLLWYMKNSNAGQMNTFSPI